MKEMVAFVLWYGNLKKRFAFRVMLSLVCIGFACSYPGMVRDRDTSRVQFGKASYYGEKFHGKSTASGEIFNQYKMTAAHPTFPFGTICKVTNLESGKSVNVRINDRGPFVKGRIIDLSYEAARRLHGLRAGVFQVRVEVLKRGDGH